MPLDDANQRRDGFNVVVPTDRQVGIMYRVDASREGRVILRIGRCLEFSQQRRNHPARFALVLDNHDKSLGQTRTTKLGCGSLDHHTKGSPVRRTSRCLSFSCERTARNVPVLGIPQ